MAFNTPFQPQTVSDKGRGITAVLCLFFGHFGVHRFYVRRPISGAIQLLTLGLFGLWSLFDLVTIVFGFFVDGDGLIISEWRLKGCLLPLALCLLLPIILSIALIALYPKQAEFLQLERVEEFLRGLPGATRSKGSLHYRSSPSSESGVIRYYDAAGVPHYVNREDLVPEQFRNKSEQAELPPLQRYQMPEAAPGVKETVPKESDTKKKKKATASTNDLFSF